MPSIEETLRGKVYAITGGNSGMGFSAAKELVSLGAKVSIAGRNPKKLAAAYEELVAIAGETSVLATRMDVCSTEEVNNWIEETVKKFGRLDGGVNAAALPAPHMVELGQLDDYTWDQVINTNLKGVMNAMRAQLNHMESGGAIVNISSIASHVGLPLNAAYTASKHGVIGLTKAVAKEYGRKGIRINAISPGFCETQMMIDAAAELGTNMPTPTETILQRNSQPIEMTHPILFLLSPWSSYVVGANYYVDGGWNC
ncbi:MAG: hypothetical protein M1834_005404 [Cirrosporium novae-zelandiae]|nr:MAG: hypothetical protein M1834_005404 [Cirrosporium novae-zelandiae]